ncbi:ribbon-helix-helix domain-containing protein [Erwinia rhapontici]
MFEYNDSENEMSEQQSVAMKISIPEKLHTSISNFSTYAGVSKSEFARAAFIAYLENSPVWKARSYFFQPNEKFRASQTESIEEKLKSSSKGSLIKVAALQIDSPDRANMIVGNLVRIKGRQISFDVPHNHRPTHIAQSIYEDGNNVKLVSGFLVVPLVDNVSTFGVDSQRFIYTVDIDYIWDVDTNVPTFSL